MRKALLEQVIKKHCRHIGHHGKNIPGHFAMEDIHELRVEYKKLRAFSRLLGQGGHFAKKGPARQLRAVYRASGKIRDIQLLTDQLNKSLQQKQWTLPVLSHELQRRLFSYKEALVKAIEGLSVRDMVKELLDGLPHGLGDAGLRKFVHLKVGTIRLLQLSLDSDEELHAVRKQLKDLIYIVRLYQRDWKMTFPFRVWKKEDALDQAAALLGDYNDQGIALSYLQSDLVNGLPPEEKELAGRLEQEWLREKERKRAELLKKLPGLLLFSSF